MLDWLASWLRQIIAVVLLAGIVDLLLPNKSMQRYVRLVAGLIILLTILSPIIRVLQGDFGTKLHESFDSWLNTPSEVKYKMPTLEDIKRDAEEMQRKQDQAADALTANKLGEAMAAEIEQKAGLAVEYIQVKLDRQNDAEQPTVTQVLVTLAPPKEEPSKDAAAGDSGGEVRIEEVGKVDEVGAVTIESGGSEPSGESAGEPESEEALAPVEEGKTVAVRSVLQESFAIDPAVVSVRGGAATAS